jgi:hypothetical protein
MTAKRSLADIASVHTELVEIGKICVHWAYLEFLLEVTYWWIFNLHNRHEEGRILTGSLSIELLSGRVRDLAHLKIADPVDREVLSAVAKRIDVIKDDRNLAVHGVRAMLPDKSVHAWAARGKYKHAPEFMTAMRLRSVTVEIRCILKELEPVLLKNNIISTIGVRD